MYFEPYFPADEHRRAQEEISRSGFRADPVLDRLDDPVLGLNVAFAWPLPAELRSEYERLGRALGALDEAVYVYPFERTHVTLATLVDFRRFPAPTAAQRAAVLGLVPAVADVLDEAVRALRPFAIDIGPPVLVRGAAFLPISNPGGEVRRVREDLRSRLAGNTLLGLEVPKAVHSTILRFRRVPDDPEALRARFEEIGRQTRFGRAQVDELLITTETRPYMAGGDVVHRATLGHAERSG